MKLLTTTHSKWISAKVSQYRGPPRSRCGKGYKIFNFSIKAECKCWECSCCFCWHVSPCEDSVISVMSLVLAWVMLCKAVLAFFALLFNCLGDWCHLYHLLCALQYTTAGLWIPFLCNAQAEFKKDNMTNMSTIIRLY